MLVKQSSSFLLKSTKHRTLSLQICVHRTVRLTTEFVDWCRNVCTLYKCTNTCQRYQLLWATWSSASLTHGQAHHKTSSTKQLVNGRIDYVQAWGKRTSLWTSATLKPALFRANTLHYRGKHVVSLHFHRSYLKANKVSKIGVTSKVKKSISFLKVCWWCWPKIIKIGPCLSKLGYSLPKLARFFWETVYK